MEQFKDFLKRKDEGILSKAWGAMKGAYQGWKGQQQNQQFNYQQIDHSLQNTLSNLTKTIDQVQDQNTKKNIFAALNQYTSIADYRYSTSPFHALKGQNQ